ncbi:hypothetical protein SAPIO_CDS10542 [Scedosporium apiospermum]|uniref:DUF1996 domain-containing protein n=1 Tax=Pseudallescheria apiosperma TaxID=563466 RepID=A0A084FVN1_PSEDA|nr:uncharacterized protein SAPIO_CDS10542 [Scedosporium apiospermum]KEZ39143.1 hypothetical protein SAPIO_CDS10542 [Scedosporium apiospermum]
MIWSTLLAFAIVAEAAPQFGMPGAGGGGGGRGFSLIRFGCSEVVITRLDPLVNPGMAPSTHMHQVVGGNAFNASMPSTDISKLATCTTCTFADDLSNYWTANMYFKARNGTYMRVKQIPNRFLDGADAGMTVYYMSPGAGKVTAFQPGFRMLYGDAARREKDGNGWKTQSCFRCYSGPNFGGDVMSPCADSKLDFEELPPHACAGGIRSTVNFPTCWDGKNLDSVNHQDHVSYPASGPTSFSQFGTCPDSHPVMIPQISLEIVWDTTPFNDPELWPEDGSQPFVLSMGDATGYGQHGDYVFGWKDDALQKAMDGACFGPTCAGLKTQAYADANKCRVQDYINEEKDGWLTELPGQRVEESH